MKLTDKSVGIKFCGLVALAAMLGMFAGCSDPAPAPPPPGKDSKAAAKAAADTNAVNGVGMNEVSVDKTAVFEDNKVTGHDPFYPASTRRGPAKTAGVPAKVRIEAELILKSIIGTGSRRFAGINDRTFAAGETASVRMPSGNLVRVRCIQIDERSVVVTVEGETEPKVLKLSQ